jgi:hypothetical protein
MTASERIEAWACWFVTGEAGLPSAFVAGSDRVPAPPCEARRPLARIRLKRVKATLHPESPCT